MVRSRKYRSRFLEVTTYCSAFFDMMTLVRATNESITHGLLMNSSIHSKQCRTGIAFTAQLPGCNVISQHQLHFQMMPFRKHSPARQANSCGIPFKQLSEFHECLQRLVSVSVFGDLQILANVKRFCNLMENRFDKRDRNFGPPQKFFGGSQIWPYLGRTDS